ncbi:hypothetical protein BgAZ_107500 [Babesia gibsoni]|uniref:K Homology domain-containing protein n=1 Tax=Babesia gibsoni TaxID=33632 RepID=A0AAD8PGB9_BABGI|nr:hypothetical protein BgAZ_107500 [Babesia gibsoni]
MDIDQPSVAAYFAPPPFVSEVDTSAEFNLSSVLDIGGLCDAILPAVDGFRGATKRNRPNLVEGDLVFCQVTREYKNRELQTEVSCINVDDMKQWSTKETYFGHLEDGFMFSVPIPYSYCLSGQQCFVLKKCSKRFKYEIAIGLNGRVWVRGMNEKETLLIARYIRMCFGLSPAQMEALFSYLEAR